MGGGTYVRDGWSYASRPRLPFFQVAAIYPILAFSLHAHFKILIRINYYVLFGDKRIS